MKKYSDYKNSSVPWIGEIPTTWNLSQLRYVIECLDGKRVPVELSLRADMQGNIPYWGAGNIVDYVDKALFDEELVLLGEDGAPFFDHTRPVAFHITEPIWANNHIHVLRIKENADPKYIVYKIVLADKGLENWKHVEPNDFIISLRSFQGGLEISYILGCITWHYIVLKPKAGVEPEYFKWLFKSPRYIQALQRTANFIRDGQDLRFSNFVQVPLPLIPMDEQKDIAEYLNKETARIDSIIADITEQIEKLKEYRQSVISEVVTGKVAVE